MTLYSATIWLKTTIDDSAKSPTSNGKDPNKQFGIKCLKPNLTPHDSKVFLEYRFIFSAFCDKCNWDRESLPDAKLANMAVWDGCKELAFDWQELLQEYYQIDDNRDVVLFQFPKPKEPGEALYGAVLFDMASKSSKYYLLEYSHDEEWIWGEYLYEFEKPTGCIVRGNFNFIHNGFLKEPQLDVFLAKVVHDNALAKHIVEQLPDGWNK